MNELKLIRNCRIISKSETKLVDLGVRGSRILFVRDSEPGAGNRGFFDAKGAIVLPGLIDCHAHLFSLAIQDMIVDLKGCVSIREMRKRIQRYLKRGRQDKLQGGWLVGRGWDQDLFRERRMPSRFDIEKGVDKLPAIMLRICGHIAVLNSKAIEILGKGFLSSFSSDLVPLGSDARPSGIVKEKALEACLKIILRKGPDELEKPFIETQKKCLALGITAVHCILSENWRAELSCLRKLDKEGKLNMKIALLLPISALDQMESLGEKRRTRFCKGTHFSIIGFKLYADGSIGARTAALKMPYSDDPNNKGVLNHSWKRISHYAKGIKRLNMMMACHSIGDAAIEQVLYSYKKSGVTREDGFRIEHCSVLSESILKKVGISILCVQPMFINSDYWINSRIGASGKRFAYPFRTLIGKTTVIAGSDAPVETIDPLRGIVSAMENRNREESLSLQESLNLYTSSAAPCAPITINCGSLESGKNCDLVVLSCNEPNQIKKAHVLSTFIDGKISYQRKRN